MLRKGVKLLIKKMVDYKKALVAILENTLENVNAGNTNITEEEASVIIDHLTMLNKGVATVSKAYACEHVLHITSNKFDYLVRKGIIPHGRKRLGFNDRQTINAEMFGLYKSQVDADFALYKNQRDGFDVTNARVSELEKEVAVLRATRPYQDALIQAAIARVAEQAEFNLFRRTCRMISGEVVLPNTPTVTGYSSYDPCACRTTTPAPSVN